jgi:glycosyltransferase involved in cell wall biosynthesis
MSAVAATGRPRPEQAPARRRSVALVISALSDGGAERVVSTLSRRWSHAGHRVAVVTISAVDTDVYELPPEVTRVALGLGRDSHHLAEAMFHASQRVIALRRALRRLDPEVVVSFLGRTNVLALLATRGLGVPVFVSERTDPRRERIGHPWGALRRLLYPHATGVVVQTERVAAWARAFCSCVHVIPNFVERPRVSADPGAESGPRTLLAVGRLSPEKGFDLLLAAFALAGPRRPDWTLTIVGEGPLRGALEAQIARLGLEGRVRLPGRTRDVASCLAAAHAFVLPSRYEGFPNALLEAMACGLPPVAFDCDSGPAEIVRHGENGLLVPAGDVAALAGALEHLMDSPQERIRLGAHARAIADELAPERVLEQWSGLLGRPER